MASYGVFLDHDIYCKHYLSDGTKAWAESYSGMAYQKPDTFPLFYVYVLASTGALASFVRIQLRCTEVPQGDLASFLIELGCPCRASRSPELS